MSSSTNTNVRTTILREVDSNISVAQPEDLDLSDYIIAGNQTVLSPETMERARESGYQKGWDQGFNEASRAVREAFALEQEEWQQEQTRRLRSALNALASAVVELQGRQGLEISHLENHLAATAFTIAEALLGRELDLAESPGRDAITRAIALAPTEGALIVRCNPGDVETLGNLDDLLAGHSYSIVADPTVESGSCLLDAKDCQVDARLSTAAQRVAEALLGNHQGDSQQ